jgi:hypothetical protein
MYGGVLTRSVSALGGGVVVSVPFFIQRGRAACARLGEDSSDRDRVAKQANCVCQNHPESKPYLVPSADYVRAAGRRPPPSCG